MIGTCITCGKKFSYYPSNRSGKYCSKKCCYSNIEWIQKQVDSKSGKRHSDESKTKMSKARKGKKKTKEWIKKIVLSRKKYYDNTGRKSDKYFLIKSSNKYKNWRKKVFERDGYKCIKCGDKSGGNLEADHIIPFSVLLYESEIIGNYDGMFSLDNGRTLCINCHKKTDSYAKHLKCHSEYKLIEAIRVLWELNTNKSKTFDAFYKEWTEKKISEIKELLNG